MNYTSNSNIAQAIYLVLKDKSHAEQNQVLGKVVQFLARRRLLSKTPSILLQLEKIINRDENRTSVKVSSAHALGEETKHHLARIFKKRYSAKEITITTKLDERLLGGMRLEVNDEVIDLTLSSKIKKLEEFLTRPA